MVVGQGIGRAVFTKTTLYQVMLRLHSKSHTDFIFANRDAAATKTFELPAGSATTAVRFAARQFGKEEVDVGSVAVLEDALPEGGTPMDKMKAMDAYLSNSFSTGPGDADALNTFIYAVQDDVRSTSKSLGPGDWAFSSMTPDQQQHTLDLLRAGQYFSPAISLASVLTQYRQAVNPPK